MFYSNSRNMFVSAILAVIFTSFSTGVSGADLMGTSSYSVFDKLEESYFLRMNQKLKIANSLNKKEVKDQISKVMSNYETGLDAGDMEKVSYHIYEQSQKYGYDPLFLTALIVTESSFYNWAESNKGAVGLMQIKPDTGVVLAYETQVQWKGSPSLYSPDVNIALGTYYLSKLVSRYGDMGLALEAYNHGPTKLDAYLRNGYRPKVYSQKVLRLYSDLKSQVI